MTWFRVMMNRNTYSYSLPLPPQSLVYLAKLSEKGKELDLSLSSDELTENAPSANFRSNVKDEYNLSVVFESSKQPYPSQSAFVDIHSMWPDIPRDAFNRIPTAEHPRTVLKAKPEVGGTASPMNVEWPNDSVFASSASPDKREAFQNLRVKKTNPPMAENNESENNLELRSNEDENSEQKEVCIWVGYEVWMEKEEKEKKSPSTSRRGSIKPIKPLYKKVCSTLKGVKHLHSFLIDPFNTSPEEFKTLRMIEVDHYVNGLSLYLTNPDPPKELSWMATEQTDKQAGPFYNIDDEDKWETFIYIIQDLAPSDFVNLLLKMPDPSLVRQSQDGIQAQERFKINGLAGISPLEEVRIAKEKESQPPPPIASTSTSTSQNTLILADNKHLFMSRNYGTFEEFFTYALIKPSDKETQTKLKIKAYNHWTNLQANEETSFDIQDLINEGFPPAIARKLISGAQQYVYTKLIWPIEMNMTSTQSLETPTSDIRATFTQTSS
ncbi:hypothetical protein DFH28DRAFT_927809 [Melampsora americana]|nr:hypothetical protein DFH28DRAFT_927809 [Melampsora americana]